MMKIGLVINPLAGIGGRVALKGSDGAQIVEEAFALGAKSRVSERVATALSMLHGGELSFYTVSGVMGEDVFGEDILSSFNFSYRIIPSRVIPSAVETQEMHTSAEDTRLAVLALCEQEIDVLLFAGGDGTARDVLDALKQNGQDEALTVIGIPAGCKIHSAVYAITPTRAGELLALLVSGTPMTQVAAQVMDLDEQAFRLGKVRSFCYGYLQVPVDDMRMQLIKQGGINHEMLVLEDIAEEIIESMQDDVLYIIGSGSTTEAIMNQLNLENTLLGVDVVLNHQLVKNDVSEQGLLALLKSLNFDSAKIIVTVIGGQGHIFGRGNQQLSPQVLTTVGLENIIIVATNEKLRTLEKRPLIADTGDNNVDKKLAGLHTVITGYEQKTLVQIA